MEPFDAYVLYLAIRQHYTSPSYDFVKYRGKMSVSRTKFDVRKDKFFFQKLAKVQDPVALLVSNLSSDPDLWITKIVGDADALARCNAYLKRRSSFEYWLKTQLRDYESPDDLIALNNNRAKLMELVLTEDYGLDLAAAMHVAFNFVPYWLEEGSDNTLMESVCLRINKHLAFFPSEDKMSIRKFVRDEFRNRA